MELNDIQEEEEKEELEEEKNGRGRDGRKMMGNYYLFENHYSDCHELLKVTFVGVRRLEIDIAGLEINVVVRTGLG